jgi:hypothetical protein
MDFPLVYANGCSYSTPSSSRKVHANYISDKLNGFLLNNSIPGSCNRRIIRTSLYDIIEQRKINPTQKIIAIISLSFELRSELWFENRVAEKAQESNFVTHTFTGDRNQIPHTKFFDKYSEGRAYYYSPYAERINLLTDLFMFTATCAKYNVNYLIFQAPMAEKLEEEHVLDFFKKEIKQDTRIFDLETFGFLDWAYENKFIPYDMLDTPEIGHYNSDAHKAFAKEILMPKLAETGQL